MKIDFPKIVKEIDFGEYHPAFKGKMFVWINPPRQILIDLDEQYEDDSEKVDNFLEILAKLLSQGSKDTHASVADLKKIIADSFDVDPLFWPWMQNRIIQEIAEYRTSLKKSLAPPAPS